MLPEKRFSINLLLVLLGICAADSHAEALARSAAYSAVISGFVFGGQIIPGANTPATTEGFIDALPWQGPVNTLIDGKRDGGAVTSWLWSNMNKRITVVFDLRRMAQVSAVRAFPRAGMGSMYDSATVQVTSSFEGLAQAPPFALQATDGGYQWTGVPVEGRFVRLVCASSAAEMSLAEVEIDGEPTGPVIPASPKPGLIATPPRDLAVFARFPKKPAGVTNVASQAKRITVASRHCDDKVGAWADDQCAMQSDPTGRALIDGNPATAITSFEGFWAHKAITAELDLGKPYEIDCVAIWSAGHAGQGRSYINSFTVWVQSAPDAAWIPAGETRNPVLPGERPATEYPIVSRWSGVSPAMGGTAAPPVISQSLRIELSGYAQSADFMHVGEIEVWAKPAQDTVATKALRLKKPVPQIAPSAIRKLATAFDWVVRDCIRALFGYSIQWSDKALLDKAVAAGFNTVLFHTSGREGHSETGWQQICRNWADVQRERKLHVLVSWPFGSDERYGNTQFGAYQPGGSQRWTRTPCPLSKEYWDRVVGDRAVVAAQAGLTGFVVDMEMYGGDMARYVGPCYGDDCWKRFVDDHLEGVRAEDIALADRPAWVAGNGLTADYARWQELQVMCILRSIEQRVHTVNPGFFLGNLLDPESLAGLARGLGTPTMPVLIFSELEYQGSIAGMPGRIAQLHGLGYPALYVPGFWPQPVKPDQLAKLIPEAASQADGYWVWSSLAYDDKSSGDYAHNKAFTAEDYWKATKAGNDALTATLMCGRGSGQAGARQGPQAAVPRIGHAPGAADWASAAVLAPFVDHATGAPAKAAAKALALWDGKRLHLRVLCDEPTPEKMTPPQGDRDWSDLWMQDSVEVFWMRLDSSRYCHLIVNSAGTISDALAEGLKPEDTGWNADVRAETHKTATGWAVTLSVPIDSDGLGQISPGALVRFEVARNRPGGGETTCWAPVQGMFKASPNLWGVLTLK